MLAIPQPEQITGDAEKQEIRPGYGRARLWLGISAVGTMVTLCTLLLVVGLPPAIAQWLDASTGNQLLGLMFFFLLYATVQLPFDFLGGYWLPKRYGRLHPARKAFWSGLLSAAAVHASMMFMVSVAMLESGRFAGLIGVVATGLIAGWLLLQLRPRVARLLANFSLQDSTPQQTLRPGDGPTIPVTRVRCDDEGFTGGVLGVLRPNRLYIPHRWTQILDQQQLNLVCMRRQLAIESGSWMRGRLLAVGFTLVGLVSSAVLVGPSQLGTASGTIQLSLWFSLWSFLGLLTLPTLSRRGVLEIDALVRDAGCTTEEFQALAGSLDQLQDGEPSRPTVVEMIFHPVPSVENRSAVSTATKSSPGANGGSAASGGTAASVGTGEPTDRPIGYWDAARTAIYLSLCGPSLLGRAVHCNCGRPALWVFLPTD